MMLITVRRVRSAVGAGRSGCGVRFEDSGFNDAIVLVRRSVLERSEADDGYDLQGTAGAADSRRTKDARHQYF
jgi:hypothetical protein